MSDIKETRRLVSISLIVLVCICVAAVALLVSPVGRGARAADRQEAELQSVLNAKVHETAPLAGIDKKVAIAKEQVDRFYRDRLPDSFSSISGELGKLAEANKVKFTTVHYQAETGDTPAGLTRVSFEGAIAGDYVQAVQFINALERDRMFFLIEGVSLVQSQGGAVRLQIRLQTYMKTS
jgi:type IV pilus assembly protein PilO